MKPFLQQIATLFYSQYGADVSRQAFVFPNRRAGLFFRKYLSEAAGKPIFSPAIFTISDLFLELSRKQVAGRIHMLFALYKIYSRQSASDETFDEFVHWGEMLLNDFDDVDKYLVNARMLFSNVTDLRAMESDFNFLSEAQIEAIRSFWSSFSPSGKGMQNFLSAWQILCGLYTELRETLAAEGKGYEGMIAREVVERIDNGEPDDEYFLPYQKVVFVGLNALSPVEEKLLQQLQKKGIADFYWDYESTKVTDKDNRASFFVERNIRMFPSQHTLPAPEPVSLTRPYIEVISIPSATGQAKQVYNLLNVTDGMTEEESLRTAVVLPDERLLIPVLNAIPGHIKRINVTMGYPLAGTPVASLADYILTMHKHVRYADRQPSFYFRDVLPILNHRYIASTAPDIIPEMARQITQNNRVYIPSEMLGATPFLKTLFTPVEDAADASAYLLSVLTELYKITGRGEEPCDAHAESTAPASVIDIEQEFIFHFIATVNQLKDAMAENTVDMKLDTYLRLLRRLTATLSIPFRGEPLSGLQIMGVLETRALDFDRLIILSMNEGIFPQKKASSSFIPYNLRRGFGLPTYEHQDSVWAYHFYRLIHRASRISLLYDSRNNALRTGEASRFIHQLHYHYQTPLHRKLIVYNVSSSAPPAIRIEKDPRVMELLSAYRKGGQRAISASAINTWLDCPLKFYFTFVEGVREEEEISQTIESNVFGSILHKVMEDIYRPFTGKTVTADLLKAIKKDTPALSRTIAAAFAEIFFKTTAQRPLEGQNFLAGEMIRKYAEKILEYDARTLTPFRYIASEKKMNTQLTLTDGSEIQLKGFIDRIDQSSDGATRITDYKSGTGLQSFRSVESLFDMREKDRPKAVMQVFMYAWMYERMPEYDGHPLRPVIYYMRSLFSGSFDPSVQLHIERGKSEPVDEFSQYSALFETSLQTCLDEIFSATTPFIQTPTRKSCTYCLFRGICG
ncbi:MAG: PD-(D/E)XK nuclease family protein [Tannerellaceae bacterium]|jgi:hypothetical protein|nr:PD-(D/E)XK nuclease family protein [Tannerellaceae bacterium]